MRVAAEKLGKYLAVLAASVCLATALLVAAASVPRDAIQQKMEESAVYINAHDQVEYLIPDAFGTQLHYPADAIWLSMAYSFDPDDPLESAMWCRYAEQENTFIKTSLYEAVFNKEPGTKEYLRYWHGAAAITKLCHLAINIEQMYQLLSVACLALFAGLVILLCSHHMVKEALVLTGSALMIYSWVMPLSLEYVWVALITLTTSLISLRFAYAGRLRALTMVLFCTGIATAYLDFLTAETLTVLVPLLLVLRFLSEDQRAGCHPVDLTARSFIAWLVGYAAMWCSKWLIASMVLGQDVMPYVLGHMEERIGTEAELPLFSYIFKAIARNVQCLMFFDSGAIGVAVLLAIVVACVVAAKARGTITINRHADKHWILLYLVLGLVPYLRFAFLHNHAYGHFCFTYRAQAATIMALCFALFEVLKANTKLQCTDQGGNAR